MFSSTPNIRPLKYKLPIARRGSIIFFKKSIRLKKDDFFPKTSKVLFNHTTRGIQNLAKQIKNWLSSIKGSKN